MGRPSTAKVPIVTKIGAKSPKGLQIANREVPVEKILRGEDTPGIGSILFQTAGDLLTERVRLFQRSGEIISKGVENIAKSAEKAKTAKPAKASDELSSDEDNEPMKHVQRKPLWPTNAWPGVDVESRHGFIFTEILRITNFIMSRKLITIILIGVYIVAEYSSTGETLFESHAVKAVDDPELVGLESSAKSKSISASSSIFIKGSPADDEFDDNDEDNEFPEFFPERGGRHRHRHRPRPTTRRRPRTTTTTRRTRRTTVTTRRPRTSRPPRDGNVNDVNVQNNVKVKSSGGRSNENKINIGSNVDIQNDDEGIF
uniref:Uncharacterized protein n=1 Tax=Romanomermis culicivorax TaxID=13658 RepID=A0A915JZB3_ROMCU